MSKLLGLIHLISNPVKAPNLLECEKFCGIKYDDIHDDQEVRDFLEEKSISRPTIHLKAVIVGFVFARNFSNYKEEQSLDSKLLDDLIASIMTLMELQADIEISFKERYSQRVLAAS